MRKILLFCSMLVMLAAAAFAQTRQISGTVADKDGQPLAGVSVVVLETQKATSTDSKGKFSIQASAGQTIRFSYVGVKPVTVKVTAETNNLDVEFKDGNTDLNEVVVTGYTTERKKDLTGAVSVVKVSDIQDIPEGNAMKELQGRVPGVTVSTDGSPAGNATVRIRGIGTLGNNDPLYVIDGMPTERGIQEINQNDIASIQVLKDASAASIYGSRAANGVIIITTKKAKAGTSRIDFSGNTSVGFYTSKLNVLNTEQRGQAYWQASVNDGTNPNNNQTYQYLWNGDYNNPVLNKIILPEYLDAAQTLRPANTNWFNEISQPSVVQDYTISVSNGSEKGNSLFSLGYYNNEGIIKESQDKKITLRFNSQYNLFNNKLQIGENMSATYMRDVLLPAADITNFALLAEPAVPVYDVSGGWGGPGPGMADRQNPLRLIEENKQNANYFGRLFGNAYADLQIIPGLHIKTSIGADYAFNYARGLQYSYVSGFLSDPTNQVSTSQTYDGNIVWQNTLTFDKKIGKSKINLLAGEENIRYVNQDLSASGQGLAIEDINYAYLSAATTNILASGSGYGYALLSFFGKANYEYDGKYLLSATIRRDGSSRFGTNNQFGTFPAASAGWRISEESFIKDNVPFISDLKLRYGYGQTGNQQIANNATYTLYQAIYGTNLTGLFDNGTAYDINGVGSGTLPSGFAQIQQGNDNLKWETSIQNNIGLDFGFLNNKFTGSVDYFIKNTTGILISPAYLAVLGAGANTYVNGASLRNTGIEAVLNYSGNIAHDLSIDVSANISSYRNKVTQLPQNVLTSYPGNGTTQTILGRSISSIYGYVAEGLFTTQAEVDNSAAQPGKGLGRIRYKDLNGDGVINNLDQQYIGNFDPDFSYGLNVNLRYKNWGLNFFFQGVQGNSVYNTYKTVTDFTSLDPGANWGTRVLQAWTPKNPTSTIPALTLVDNNDEARGSTYYVENGSYCKLRNLQLSYNLGDALKKFKIHNAKVYIQGSNLLTIKSKSYTDPDPENSTNEFPIPVITTVGFDLTF